MPLINFAKAIPTPSKRLKKSLKIQSTQETHSQPSQFQLHYKKILLTSFAIIILMPIFNFATKKYRSPRLSRPYLR